KKKEKITQRRALLLSSISVTKDFLGCGWSRLLPPVPVTQCREQKDSRHAGQCASDKEDAVSVSEAVRGAQAFDHSAGKPLQDLSQPGIGRTQERILRGGVSEIGELRRGGRQRNA